MDTPMVSSKAVNDYIRSFSAIVQKRLQAVQKIIREEVDSSEEVISYGVPAFKRNNKYVVYFAAFKDHISIYPASDAMEQSLPEIKKHRTGKGTLQFPLDKQIPLPLVRKVVRYLVKENKERTRK